MREPEPLSTGEITGFESRLLRAARSDQMPPELKLRMAHALQTSLSSGGAAGGASKSLLSSSLSSKTLLVLSAVVLVAVGGGLVVRRGFAGRAKTVAADGMPPPVVSPAAPGVAAVAGGTVVAAGGNFSARPGPTTPAANLAPAAHGHLAGGGELREEIALLDQAREALKNESPQRALALLDRYTRRFVHGTFAPEAEALRIEALVRDGQSDRARTLGRRFLAQHPASPLADRVERTLAARSIE
jgi:hypothetical protein